jgi:hypothetical protein
VTHVARDHGQAPRQGDRGDPEIWFVQSAALSLQLGSQRTVDFGGLSIEREYGGRLSNNLADPVYQLGCPTLGRTEQKLTERHRGGELLPGRQSSQAPDQVERRIPLEDR